MHLQWNDELLTGIENIDHHHKELFRITNRFLKACEEGKSKDKMVDLLRFLEAYVTEHFSAEEDLMKLHYYTDYTAHQEVHADFSKKFTDLKQLLNHGDNLYVSLRLYDILNTWLIQHIGTFDKALCIFLITIKQA